jgi:CRP-like cAMP-binding protein
MAIEFSWMDLLARVELFSSLDRPTLARLADYFEPVRVTAGAEVCRKGDASDGLYVITGGRFGAYGGLDADQAENELQMMVAGDFFGELSLLSGEPRSATIRALEDGTLARLPNTKFEELLHNEPKVAQSIAVALVRRLSESYAQLEVKIDARTQELRQALDRQTRISEVLKLLSRSAFDLKAVMRLCLESAVRFCDAQFGLIYRQGPTELELVALHALDPRLERVIRQTGTRLEAGSFASWVQREAEVLNLANIAESAVFDERVAALFTNIDLKAALGVPLLQLTSSLPADSTEPPPIPAGVLTIFRTDDVPFGDIHVDLAETFADQAAIAIENVRLLTEVQQKTKEVEKLRIEIDEAMRQRQVNEITDTDFFQQLEGKAKQMRDQHRARTQERGGRAGSSLFARIGRPPGE